MHPGNEVVKFTIGLAVQWNPVNTPDTKWTCSRGHAIVSVLSGCPYIQRDFRKNVTDKIRLKSKTTKEEEQCDQRSRLHRKGKEVILCVQGFRKLG